MFWGKHLREIQQEKYRKFVLENTRGEFHREHYQGKSLEFRVCVGFGSFSGLVALGCSHLGAILVLSWGYLELSWG